MYNFAVVLQILACIVFLVLVGVFVWPILFSSHAMKKRKLGAMDTLESEKLLETRQAAQANLRFLGLPSVHAGRNILNVPVFDPSREDGWDSRRQIITFSRIMAYLRQGAMPGDFVELDGCYALFATNGKAFILQAHNLTTREEAYLEKQRKDAVEKGDGIIEDFQGLQWKIAAACGSHRIVRAGEKAQSHMQVLSVHPELGKNGIVSCLPPNLLNQKEHDYFDMRAKSLDGDRILVFFYTGGKWNCFMGRELTVEERDRLQAL